MTLLVALLIQLTSVILLRVALGKKTWLSRPFPIMIIIATLYHGISEILLLNSYVSENNFYRSYYPELDYHLASLVISFAIFVSCVGYVSIYSINKKRGLPDSSGLPDALKTLDWRILSILLIPLAVATFQGRGYSSGNVMDYYSMTLTEVLASTFFRVLTPLTAFAVIAKHGQRWFLPVIALQSLLLAAAGQRLAILIAAIVVMMMASLVDIRLPKRSIISVGVVSIFLVLAITSLRADDGRTVFYSDSGLQNRVSSLFTAAFANSTSVAEADTPLLTQAAERFDSNEWAAGIIDGMESTPAPGLRGVFESLSQVVPAFLNPDKRELSLLGSSPEQYQIEHFGLLPADHLPGFYGLWLGIAGPYLYLPLMLTCGLLFGLIEAWIYSRVTAARLVWLVLLSTAAFVYEAGPVSMLTMLRFGIILGPAVWLVQTAMKRRRNSKEVINRKFNKFCHQNHTRKNE